MVPPALARLVVLAAAAAAVALAGTRLHDDRACARARDRIDAALFRHRLPARGLSAELGTLTGSCRGATTLARVATVLTTAGHRSEAVALARRAARDEPDNVWTWVALGQALQRDDPAGSRRAYARAQALNPRGRLPRAIGAGAARPTA